MSWIDDTAQALVNMATNEYKDIKEKNILTVQPYAKRFVIAYNNFKTINNQNFSSILEQIQNQINNNDDNNNNNKLMKAYLLQTNLAKLTLDQLNRIKQRRMLYLLAFDFQNAYRIYQGKKVSEVLYVTDSGQIYKTSLFTLAISSTYDFTRNINRVAGLSKISGVKNILDDFQLTEELSNNLKNLFSIYRNMSSAITKYSTQVLTKTGALSNEKKSQTLFYKIDVEGNIRYKGAQTVFIKNKDKLFYIINKGDLKEGYAYSVLSQLKDISVRSLDPLLLIEKGLSQVDNKGSILSEDLVFGNEEFAVKGSGASLPGLRQFYDLAIKVITNQMDDEKKDIQQIEKDSKNLRNLVDTEAQNKLNEINNSLRELGIGIKIKPTDF